jgi:hypothetical protein
MISTYAQIPVRLALSTVSAPPVTPVDQNTGKQPKFFRAQGVAVQVAVFDNMGNAVDLSNLSYLQLVLMQSATAPVPLVTKTVLAADIEVVIQDEDWNDGSAENATFILTAADTDQSLGGTGLQTYWMAIQGMTTAGVPITYGAGSVTLYNPGGQIPSPVPGIASEHEQTNGSGNSTIQPTALVHTELLTVNGAARTSALILSVVGAANGNTIRVSMTLPATASIILNFESGVLTGPLAATLTTDGTHLTAVADFVYSFNLGQWICTLLAYPSIPV